ncbi:MAG TPA: PIN domain-containing protein [Caulobacteraceae bacterium]|nr:PIN domain-containing protein [Caulobacteraceae bacterium]
MIAADTSSIVAFLSGDTGDDVARIEAAMSRGMLVIPPPVVAELYSKPDRTQIAPLLQEIPIMAVADGYWERAGESRRTLLSRGLKAAIADALIAQCCIDAGVSLIARDRDYRHFERWCGLKLAV